MKQKELSRWLRGIVIVGWFTCALLAWPIAPKLARDAAFDAPEMEGLIWPCLTFCWLGLVVVAVALWFAWQIFGEIGHDNSFCRKNARRLTMISRLALIDTVLCILAIIFLMLAGAMHPGVLLLVLLIAVIGAGFTVAAAALSHLTLKAALLQEENDLTV